MRIVYIGTGEIGLPALRWLLRSGHEVAGVVTQPDKPAGRKQELLASPIKLEALAHGLPVFQPVKIRAPEAVAQIASLAPDVIVVMAYGQILPKAVLEIPRLACLNLHASLLPRHRGAAPIQSAILSGDEESGITVMYMDEGLDTGDVLLAEAIPITDQETGGTLHDRLAEIAPGALRNALILLERGFPPRVKQDSTLATYAPKLDRKDGMISWDRPDWEVDRHIRAMTPWPGAFTWLQQADGPPKKLKIFDAGPFPCFPQGEPGVVIGSFMAGIAGSLLVSCGKGVVIIRSLQLEGQRRMTAKEFLRGRPIPPGTRLLSQP